MPSEAPLEKLPPQNIEAEMAVLGSMLIDEDAVAQAIEILSADYFYRESHRHIYSCILNLFNVNKAVDLITICDELKSRTSWKGRGAQLSGIPGKSCPFVG